MDNIGYIVFILLYLLLTSYLKKRRRQEAQRQLEPEEPAERETRGGLQTDFLKEILGGKMFPVEEETEVEESTWEPEPEISPVQEGVPESTIPKRKPLGVDIKPFPEQQGIATIEHAVAPGQAGANQPNPYREMLQSFVSKPDNLKQAILLKEIIDKPRALRREIR